ncbi:MAG: FixH family protein [Rhizobiaceae bacterium]
MSANADKGKPFTGVHMLAVLGLFFGTIITVNLVMAYYANSTWSGLVVKNSYVASQEFNSKVADVKAQEALGLKGRLTAGNGIVHWTLTNAVGTPADTIAVQVLFRRPVTDKADFTVDMAKDAAGNWTGKHALADGVWIAVIDVQTREHGTWRETLRFTVSEGAIK